MTSARPELARDIEDVGSRAAHALRLRGAGREALAAWSGAARWMLLVPACVLAVHLLLRLLGGDSLRIGFGWITLLALAPAAVAAVVVLGRRLAHGTDARDGLARLDRELEAEGRLQAAHEFLGTAERTSFMAAAIADSESHVERARAHKLSADAYRQDVTRAWLVTLASVALGALAAWLAPELEPRADGSVGGDLPAVAARETAARRDRPDAPPAEQPPVLPPRATEIKPRSQSPAGNRQERPAANEPDRQARESFGKTGEGLAANATPTNSSSDSRGLQSTQAPPTEKGDSGKPSQKKPKTPKPDKNTASPKKKLEQSGSTAGKGTGAGSNKNPGSTEWQSKDQVTTDEEVPLDNDQDVDEETEESEARGGLQPSLRDRRPAVNRDLMIGFGNNPPPPDANGRGGPGEHKKSRGVASLVLGVPIPDHVKADPNPGRIKITHERVEPRADEAAPIEASARTERAQPIGSLARRELTPWMKQMVRAYFLKIRKPTP